MQGSASARTKHADYEPGRGVDGETEKAGARRGGRSDGPGAPDSPNPAGAPPAMQRHAQARGAPAAARVAAEVWNGRAASGRDVLFRERRRARRDSTQPAVGGGRGAAIERGCDVLGGSSRPASPAAGARGSKRGQPCRTAAPHVEGNPARRGWSGRGFLGSRRSQPARGGKGGQAAPSAEVRPLGAGKGAGGGDSGDKAGCRSKKTSWAEGSTRMH